MMWRAICWISLGLTLCSGCASTRLMEPQCENVREHDITVTTPQIYVGGYDNEMCDNFAKQLGRSLTDLCANTPSGEDSKNQDGLTLVDVQIRLGDRGGRNAPLPLPIAITPLALLPSLHCVTFTAAYTVTNHLVPVAYHGTALITCDGTYSGWAWFRARAANKLEREIITSAPLYVARAILSDYRHGRLAYENAKRDLIAARRMQEDAQRVKKEAQDAAEAAARRLQDEVQREHKAAEAGDPMAQYNMGLRCRSGIGVEVDLPKAFSWFKKSAEQGMPYAQHAVALCYANGEGVSRSMINAVAWCEKAAEQGYVRGQYMLGTYYLNGEGVIRDPRMAYRWFLLVSAWGGESLRPLLEKVEASLSASDANEARSWATTWRPKRNRSDCAPDRIAGETVSSGTGFFVSTNGYIVTASHVVAGSTRVKVRFGDEMLDAHLVASDPANDVAILKISGDIPRAFPALYLPQNPAVRLGERVFTVGFPLPTLQGNNPKLSKGDVCALTGMRDDVRHMQISIPVQAGNSGGVLANEHGEVVGIIVSKLNALIVAGVTGDLIQNVNYAVKGAYVRTLVETAPGVLGAFPKPLSESCSVDEVINHVKACSVLIMAEGADDAVSSK